MEEKDLMVEEVIDDAAEEIAKVKTGLSTPVAMLIGSGLTLAAIVGYKKLKKVIADRKAMELEEPDVVEEDVSDVKTDSSKEDEDSEN